ncbi:MAG: hypothetical protein KatS3mg124_1134 [Porticoccaceae bacterium]|nr:MAG: hypothetical protein KatS3mg124_1134 [Porticoccaceae bacterium]
MAHRRFREGCRACHRAWLLCWLLASPLAAAERLLLLYPVVREPYQTVYREIVAGLAAHDPGSALVVRPLDGGGELPPADAVVALGRRAVAAAAATGRPVFAAVANRRDLAVPGCCRAALLLRPSARAYLEPLLAFFPRVSRVLVVYAEGEDGELVRTAEQWLAARGRRLLALPAADLEGAAQAWRTALAAARPGDGVWLLAGNGLLDMTLVDLVLDVAWEKRLAVFSANPALVRRGALYAVYPDNRGVGGRLAEILAAAEEGRLPEGHVEPLERVQVAYNERTGNHLGIGLTPALRARIDLLLAPF